jgi:hypothetical protein
MHRNWVWDENEGELAQVSKGNTVGPAQLTVGVIRNENIAYRLIPQQPTEDEHVDINEPWSHSCVPITNDIIPHQDTCGKLRLRQPCLQAHALDYKVGWVGPIRGPRRQCLGGGDGQVMENIGG